jgi:hypothetical protein
MAWLEFYRGILAVKKEGLRLMLFKHVHEVTHEHYDLRINRFADSFEVSKLLRIHFANPTRQAPLEDKGQRIPVLREISAPC